MQCPWHADRAASASYNTILQRYRCHGCGIAGDGFDLVQEINRCDFVTAKEWCARNLGYSGNLTSSNRTDAPSKLTQRRNRLRATLIRQRYGKR